MLTDWGGISSGKLEAWVNHLKTGVPTATGTHAVCQFDLDNLAWSATMLKNSVTVRLWEEVESELAYGATGPEIFHAIMRRFQHSSASASRALIANLQTMKLNKEPSMNLDTFSTKLTELIRRIEGCDSTSIPADLSTLVAQCFLDTDVDEFKLCASHIFNQVDLNPSAMTWRGIITDLKVKYRSLVGLDCWPHKNKKSNADEMAAMKGTINKLTQQIASMKTNDNKGGKKDLSNVECFNCKKKGHFSRDCPDKPSSNGSGNGNSSNSNSSGEGTKWVKAKPADGEAHIKTVNGSEYKWCDRCKRWQKDKNHHVTADHKTKAELAAAKGESGSGNNSSNNSSGAGNVGGLRMMGGLFCGFLNNNDESLNF